MKDSETFLSWECEVCSFSNPPGLSPAGARICALCGVPRSSVPAPVISASASQHLSSSLPSLSSPTSHSPTSSSRPSDPSLQPSTISCPACTFLNHPSLRSCELCSTPLPRAQTQRNSQTHLGMKSAPTSRPDSPDVAGDDGETLIMKLSFRKGGDKAFYAVLKRTLKTKAWKASRDVWI